MAADVDGDELPARVQQATGGASIRLATHAIGGAMVLRLADCLAEGGTVLNYGLLSGQPCQLGAHHHLQAHHADRLLAAKGADLDGGPDLEAPYADLAARVADGTLRVEVEAAYPIEEIKAALAHAEREGRGGKSLVMPDRPVDVAARPCEMALGGAAGPPDAPTRDFC